jgi:hypothetical protein
MSYLNTGFTIAGLLVVAFLICIALFYIGKARGRHLFISYKREDAEKAKMVRHALQRLPFDVWWDERLQTGQRWNEKIDEALLKAEAVVVLWSEAAGWL